MAIFNEPHHNSIIDCQLLFDWRRAAEDLEVESLLLATITIDPIKESTVLLIHRILIEPKSSTSTQDLRQPQQIFSISSSALSS